MVWQENQQLEKTDLSGITWKKDGPKYWETRQRSPERKEYNTESLILNVTIDTSQSPDYNLKSPRCSPKKKNEMKNRQVISPLNLKDEQINITFKP